MMFRRALLISAAAVLSSAGAAMAAPVKGVLYRNPHCACCGAYADYLDRNGFDVTLKSTYDLTKVNARLGVPDALAGCHTMVLEDHYVVSGLVPVAAIRKLLAERPDIRGISLPDMPPGAPGMMGTKTGPFVIIAITKDGTSRVFDTL